MAKKNAAVVSLAVVDRAIWRTIKNACPACYSGDRPERGDDGRWWHIGYDEIGDEGEPEDRDCDASDLHTALADIRAKAEGKGA